MKATNSSPTEYSQTTTQQKRGQTRLSRLITTQYKTKAAKHYNPANDSNKNQHIKQRKQKTRLELSNSARTRMTRTPHNKTEQTQYKQLGILTANETKQKKINTHQPDSK